jgi:hypothetical protein
MVHEPDEIQLLYTSSARHPFTQQELRELLTLSRRNNESLGVTGLLIYQYRTFAQILEGRQETVEGLFARIAADTRHGQIEILEKQPISRRNFADWSMGFFQSTPQRVGELPGFTDLLGDEFSDKLWELKPVVARRLLWAFREGRWRQNVETGVSPPVESAR